MKYIHIPTFIIFGVSIFCISTAHFELANAIILLGWYVCDTDSDIQSLNGVYGQAHYATKGQNYEDGMCT